MSVTTLAVRMFSDGVRAPLITDLQKRFNLQCTVDGKKGILFKHEEVPVPSPRSAFDCSSGFVPFRKTKISSFLIQHPLKPWESSIPTRSHCWKSWDGTNRKSADARDAVYMYSCKAKRPVNDSDTADTSSLPVIFQPKPRPNTVAKSRLSDPPKNDSLGHRRSYTAVQRSKADQVRARKAFMKKEFAQRLNTNKAAFFAVRRMFPVNEDTRPVDNGHTDIPKGQHVLDRNESNSIPRLPVKIDRPMKKEKGRYRPFSRTAVKTPKHDFENSSTDQKGPQSAEAYKVILHRRREHLREQRKRNTSVSTPISQFRQTNNTMVSHYDDTETKLLQSVIEVNKPPSRLPSAKTPATPACSVRGTSAKGNENAINE